MSSVTPVSVVVVVAADEVDTCSAGVAVFVSSAGSSYWVSSSMTRLRSASVGGGRVTSSTSFPTSFWWLTAELVVKSGSSVVAKGTVGVMKNDKVVSESSDSSFSFDDEVVVTTRVSSTNSPPVVVVSK